MSDSEDIIDIPKPHVKDYDENLQEATRQAQIRNKRVRDELHASLHNKYTLSEIVAYMGFVMWIIYLLRIFI